jgi:anthranilate phosphoribosyltransferase
MITQSDLQNLIHLRMPQTEAQALLGQLTPDQVTLPLLTEALQCIRSTALPVGIPDVDVLDCCGTGGSGLSHFNTSTTVAFVLAAAGVPVVKFGNRGFSSRCGSFDLLERIGIPYQIDVARVSDILQETNLVFLFAPACYPALAPFNQLRKTLKIRTLFNFLGPLLNPVSPAYRLLGVSDARMQNIMAESLAKSSNNKNTWLVHGTNGLDEIALDVPTRVLSVQNGKIDEALLPPVYPAISLPSGDHEPKDNLGIFQRILTGDETESVYYQMVCQNAAAALLVSGKAGSLEEGLREVRSLLKTGVVFKSVEHCRRVHAQFSN